MAECAEGANLAVADGERWPLKKDTRAQTCLYRETSKVVDGYEQHRP